MLSNINGLRLVVWMVGSGGDLKAFPEAWFDWLAVVLSRVELDGVWPEGLLDAHVTMIPKTDGDATSLWAASLVCLACCLPHLGFCQASSLGWLASVLAPFFPFLALEVVVGL